MFNSMVTNFFKIGVSYEQLAHDFAMMKLNKKFNDSKIETYNQLLEEYLNELDACRCLLKAAYGDTIFND